MIPRRTVIDQMGRTVSVPQRPQRIISLVPSQTELLLYLNLQNELVGRTKFCIHPQPAVSHILSIGGTKKFRFDLIDQLQPDLIIGNKEENYQEGIDQLAEKYPVWLSDITDLEDALQMIDALGSITNRQSAAMNLSDQIKENFAQLPRPQKKYTAAYLIWQNPYMSVNQNTFIHDMLVRAGFSNRWANESSRYPTLTLDELQRADLDYLLLSSEPFPFDQSHQQQLQQLLPNTKILLVDGELFSWYGNRLLDTPAYLHQLLS